MEGEERFEHPYVQDFISANQLFFFFKCQATSSFEGNIRDCKIIDTIVLKLMNMLDNGILTLESVRDMVSYASEMRLSFENMDLQMDNVVQNSDSQAQLSETEDNLDEDVRNNMVLQINVVERNDEMLSEDEMNTLQDTGNSQKFDNSLRVNENFESSSMNHGDLNCDEMESSEGVRDLSKFPNDCASFGSYPESMHRNNNRLAFSSQSGLKVAEVDTAVEDSGVEYSDEEASFSDNFGRPFLSFEEEVFRNRIFSATPDCASSFKKPDSFWNSHFYSV